MIDGAVERKNQYLGRTTHAAAATIAAAEGDLFQGKNGGFLTAAVQIVEFSGMFATKLSVEI